MKNSRSLTLYLSLLAMVAVISCGPRFKASNKAIRNPQRVGLINTQEMNELSIAAVTAPWSEDKALYCSRYVRQIFEKYFESKELKLKARLFGWTALETESLWKKNRLLYSLSEINDSGGLKPGDLVFQDYEDLGHVGIIVEFNNELFVSENTIRYGFGRSDFRALTVIRKFGKIKSVGRM